MGDWLISGTPFATAIPTTISIVSGQIRLVNALWGSGTSVTNVKYTRTTSLFVNATGGHLLNFDQSLPFP